MVSATVPPSVLEEGPLNEEFGFSPRRRMAGDAREGGGLDDAPTLGRGTSAAVVQSLFSYIRPGYIHSGYNRDHGGTTEPERSRNVTLKRTCHPVFVLYLTQNDLLGVG